MPRVLHRYLRFAMIDRCLRDSSHEYHIGDIHEECNRIMMQMYGTSISRRTVQYDLCILQQPPFCIDLDEKLRERGVYRYSNVNCPKPNFLELDD